MSNIEAKGTCPACRDESIVLEGGTGRIICRKKKGTGHDCCPDPQQITRIMNMARWIDESSGSEEDVFRAEISLPDEWSVVQASRFGQKLDELDGVIHRVNLGENKIVIQIHPPHRLSHDYIPAGTHEFARGWGMRHVMGVLSDVFGYSIEWREYRVSIYRPWRDLRRSKETVTV